MCVTCIAFLFLFFFSFSFSFSLRDLFFWRLVEAWLAVVELAHCPWVGLALHWFRGRRPGVTGATGGGERGKE